MKIREELKNSYKLHISVIIISDIHRERDSLCFLFLKGDYDTSPMVSR
jgi:hypothetical protein